MAKKPAEKKMDKLVREKAVTKKDFTDKPAPEVWTDALFKEYVEIKRNAYKDGDDFYKRYAWQDINEMMDQVMAGEIIVQKELDTE